MDIFKPMNSVFLEVLLLLHVFTGMLGLVAGTINILGRKTGRIHKSVGIWFTVSMSITCVLSIELSAHTGNIFLLSTGVFTLYLVLTGFRAHGHFRRRETVPITKIDWLLSVAMILAGMILTGIGLRALIHGSVMGIVPLLFSVIGIFQVRMDLKHYRNPPEDRMVWLRIHLGRMTGAFIAACTAFLVNNAHRFGLPGPNVIWWVAPTLLLSPFLFRWLQRYPRKV